MANEKLVTLPQLTKTSEYSKQYTDNTSANLNDKINNLSYNDLQDIPDITQIVNNAIAENTKKTITIYWEDITTDESSTDTFTIRENYNSIYDGHRTRDMVDYCIMHYREIDTQSGYANDQGSIIPTLVENCEDLVMPTWRYNTQPYDTTYISFISYDIMYRLSLTWDESTYKPNVRLISTIPLNLTDASEVAM